MPERIINKGMGGFLNPPTHPEHDYSVRGCWRKDIRDYDYHCSLSSAIGEDSYVESEAIKSEARKLLDDWNKNKPDLENDIIQDWIFQVMGYFRNCFQAENGSWNASDLRIVTFSTKNLIIENQDKHAGVHCIRKYYPEFKLKLKHLNNAYWGSKR